MGKYILPVLLFMPLLLWSQEVKPGGEDPGISFSNIQFFADSSKLSGEARWELKEIAHILKKTPERKITITGHTAQASTEEEQLALSLERAHVVADYLVFLKAVKRENITVQGYGAAQPVGNNDTPSGQALNRRVEISAE